MQARPSHGGTRVAYAWDGAGDDMCALHTEEEGWRGLPMPHVKEVDGVGRITWGKGAATAMHLDLEGTHLR
jgi:hypothetical protein